MSCAIEAEELRRSYEERIELWSRIFYVPQVVTYERFASFQGLRQARTEVHWAVQDFGKER
jgi:hypothetical protein